MKKNVVLLDTGRDAYTPEQCYDLEWGRETLTVGELTEILSGFDPDAPIFFRNDNGYTFGFLSEGRISEDEFEFSDNGLIRNNADLSAIRGERENDMDDYDGAAVTNIYGEAQRRLRQIDALIASGGGVYEEYNLARRAQLIEEYNERLRRFGVIDPHVEDTV